ncbi:hypothetical protein DPMN_109155 [Dreissena polymorpha]|uniref:Uncharacterized protein n=1 Tax=Dreissena polymorpha TaxID=45954 RepID=A0A9D4KA23_DREPO|nr:hypothetical protein DPMN_109155 [Dreissena polymorpha]
MQHQPPNQERTLNVSILAILLGGPTRPGSRFCTSAQCPCLRTQARDVRLLLTG